jgi:hypothetical protein
MRAPIRLVWAVCLLGMLGFFAVVLAEHLLRQGLSPASHEISEYANGPHSELMEIGFAAWALSLAAEALLVLWTRRGRALATRLVSGLLLCAAAGIAVTAIFNTQTSAGHLPAGVMYTKAGELHNLGSGLALVALLLATIASIVAFEVHSYRRFTVLLLVGGLGMAGVLLLVGPEVAGVRQRVLLLAALLWQLRVGREATEAHEH